MGHPQHLAITLSGLLCVAASRPVLVGTVTRIVDGDHGRKTIGFARSDAYRAVPR